MTSERKRAQRALVRQSKALAMRQAEEFIAGTRVSPADVMKDNLDFWNGKALELTRQLEAATFDSDDPQAANETFRAMLLARKKAQDCAADLAPYKHPRMANIEFTPPPPREPDFPSIDGLDPVKAGELYAQRLARSRGR